MRSPSAAQWIGGAQALMLKVAILMVPAIFVDAVCVGGAPTSAFYTERTLDVRSLYL